MKATFNLKVRQLERNKAIILNITFKEQIELCVLEFSNRQIKTNNLPLNSVSDFNDYNLLIFCMD